MDTNLNVATAPKDSTFQVRINSDIKKAVEDIYAKTGMTLTDAIRGLCDYEEKGPEVSKMFDVRCNYKLRECIKKQHEICRETKGCVIRFSYKNQRRKLYELRKKSTSIKKDDEFNPGKFGGETGCQPSNRI